MTTPVQQLDLRLVPGALSVWGATLFGVLAGWRPALVLAFVLVIGAAAVWSLGVARVGAGIVAALALGGGFSFAIAVRAQAVGDHPLARAHADTYVTATVELSDDPRPVKAPGPSRVMVTAALVEFENSRGITRSGGAVVVVAPADGWRTLLPGQRVRFRAAVAEPLHRDLTVATLRAAAEPLWTSRPSLVQRFAGDVRARFAAAAEAALPGAAGGLLPGLVVGDTSRLPEDVRDEFKTAGLSHLTAVSGANVAIIVGAVLLAARALTVGPRTAVVVAAVALAMFVVLARPSPSVLRAAVMGSIGLLGLITSRRKQAVPALAAAVIVLLALYPALAVNMGFALSVLATAGLVLVAPTWADWLRGHGWPRAPAEVLAVATAAFAVTAPLVAALSGTVSLVAIGANVLVGWVIAPITVLGAVSAILASIWLPLGVVVADLTGAPLWWLLWVAHEAAALPGGSLTVWDGLGGGVVIALVGCGLVLAVWSVRVPGRAGRRTPVRRSPRD
ncbi:ComEC/Rec2 family competence protein [Antrihabitans sp. YC2-6]|uniref:ComEC/Rec2 family competence protein n=1 Tax=Antrihabitans sp. YC2-6 TaxID=2799498 RepID=UPI0018F5B9C2|nr:ComEC/Rec2 family competence protein [Antrihabitans sp. YC2-6]MBJ8346827.1 ComEC/Rec2 family competence protein [Antrihabitans sp. YC2-6]